MKKATFEEYTEAKKEIMIGGECKEYSSLDEYGRSHKVICCKDGNAFWEITDNDATEFWSTKYPDSRKYEVERELARELAREIGTNMQETDYLKLSNMGDTKHMTDDEARLFVGEEFGFDPLKVQIVHEVADYYKDKRYSVKWHIYRRDPLYNATDWNYLRFNVCGWQYECRNGMLSFYNS